MHKNNYKRKGSYIRRRNVEFSEMPNNKKKKSKEGKTKIYENKFWSRKIIKINNFFLLVNMRFECLLE